MKINEISKKLNLLFPNAQTELEYNNNFQLLIAIIMSAQTTDKQVNKINKIFFTKFLTPNELYNFGEENIKECIKTIGLYNSKAKNIYKTAEILTKEYNQIIPEDIFELQKLPGVGIKTAKVWLSVVKNAQYLAVDTHVHRVLNRLGIVKTQTPTQTDKICEKKLKNEDLANLHHTLILFGRYYCTAKNPKCKSCDFKGFCNYYNKNSH